MNYKIWVYQNNGKNEFYKWRNKLPKIQIAKLEEKIDKLSINGMELLPLTLAGTDVAGILKLKIQGNPKLRPLLCRGTQEIDEEFTLLLGAKEVQNNFEPKNALATALSNKNDVTADVNLRVIYEPYEI